MWRLFLCALNIGHKLVSVLNSGAKKRSEQTV